MGPVPEAQERSARHRPRPPPSQVQPRRAAAASQHRARRDVGDRPASGHLRRDPSLRRRTTPTTPPSALACSACGRSPAATSSPIPQRIALDVKYVKTWSIWADIDDPGARHPGRAVRSRRLLARGPRKALSINLRQTAGTRAPRARFCVRGQPGQRVSAYADVEDSDRERPVRRVERRHQLTDC